MKLSEEKYICLLLDTMEPITLPHSHLKWIYLKNFMCRKVIKIKLGGSQKKIFFFGNDITQSGKWHATF